MTDHLPEAYLSFRAEFPALMAALDGVGQAADAAGPLDGREQRLVKLALSIGSGAQGAVRSNVRRALEAGATPEEIMHVVGLAVSTIGLPGAVAGYGWVREVLGAD